MKSALIILFISICSVTFGQKVIKKASEPATVTMKAIDEKTQLELPAQYTVQAVLAKKSFKGSSKPGDSFSLVLTKTDTLIVITRVKGLLRN